MTEPSEGQPSQLQPTEGQPTEGQPTEGHPTEGQPSQGQPSEEQIERLRRSGIRLDADGRFIHEGEEVRHAGLRAALWRWLDQNPPPDNRYVLRLDERRFVYLDVDDAPHVVRSLRWEGDRAVLRLADDSEEVLRPETLRLGAGGAAYCRVKGRFDARLSSGAWAALADRIEEREGAAWLVTGATRVRLGAV